MSDKRILITTKAAPAQDGFGHPPRDASVNSMWAGRYARISPANYVPTSGTVLPEGNCFGQYLIYNPASNNWEIATKAANEAAGVTNTPLGCNALNNLITGVGNVAVGVNCASNMTTGSDNVAIGHGSLQQGTSITDIVAIGTDTLSLVTSDPTIQGSVAIGTKALSSATTAITTPTPAFLAIGYEALTNADIGGGCIGIGYQAGKAITTGFNNVAIGNGALALGVGGFMRNCVAIGNEALANNNSAGNGNIGIGWRAGANITTSAGNTIIGNLAGAFLTFGGGTIVGNGAATVATTATDCTLFGNSAGPQITTGNQNVGFGFQALSGLVTGSNNIAIGNAAACSGAGDNFSLTIGNGAVGAGSGTTVISPNYVRNSASTAALQYNNVTGEITYLISSKRFKENIQNLRPLPNVIDKLRPVEFDLKDKGEHDIGLIAEEVDEVFPDMVIRDADGQITSIKYNWLPILLLKELQALKQKLNY